MALHGSLTVIWTASTRLVANGVALTLLKMIAAPQTFGLGRVSMKRSSLNLQRVSRFQERPGTLPSDLQKEFGGALGHH